MIIFVTDYKDYYIKSFNLKLYNDIRVVSKEEGLEIYKNKLKGKRKVCLDVEANGLDPYVNKVVGLGIKVSNFKFVFDTTNDYITIVSLLKNKLVIGQNLKYDMKMLHNNGKVMFSKIYDTLIAEQRLFMGTKDSKALDALIGKYCNKIILKDVRNSFIGVNPDTFRFSISQLRYLVGDLEYLEEIRNKQRKFIKQFSMEFLINGIEFPLLEAVANAELEGFEVDSELWIKNVQAEEEHNFEILCKLDNIFNKIKETSNYNNGYFKSIVSSNRFKNKREKPDILGNLNKKKLFMQQDLFGEMSTLSTKVKGKVYENNIKWTSPKEIQLIAGALGIALPTEYGSEIPSIGANSFKLLKPISTFKLGKGRLVEYLEDASIPLLERELLETIRDLNASTTNLGTFGRAFLEKRNPVTKKFHTIFRTCSANTGRFQSGGGVKESDKYNAQNIPAKLEYRIPFSANKEHYNILTADYSGAELIVMASHAQDFRLIELSKGDMHTHMGNKMYRAIYGHRAWNLYNSAKQGTYSSTKLAEMNKVYKEYVDKAKNYTIAKEERKGCKPMTFK